MYTQLAATIGNSAWAKTLKVLASLRSHTMQLAMWPFYLKQPTATTY